MRSAFESGELNQYNISIISAVRIPEERDADFFGHQKEANRIRETGTLYFWNWMDGEADRSERGFLRVLGYAWKKCMEEEAESASPAPRAGKRTAA